MPKKHEPPCFEALTYGPKKKWNDAGRLIDDRGFFIAPAGKGIDIAEIACTASQDNARQEEWARLFSAAPALLAACKAVLKGEEVYDAAGICLGTAAALIPTKLRLQLSAAIAQAEGQAVRHADR